MTGSADASVLRAYFESIDAGDLESVFDLFADDIEYHRPGFGTYSGIDEFKEFYLEDRPIEDGAHHIDWMLVDDDRIAVRGTFTGRIDGEEVSFGIADFHRFDETGKIVERWSYTNRGEV